MDFKTEGAIALRSKCKAPYDPELHENHKKPWLKEDLIYLCKYYDGTAKGDMALALGRTYAACAQMALSLKKCGIFSFYKSMEEEK